MDCCKYYERKDPDEGQWQEKDMQKSRTCTDFFCFIIFIIFVAGMGIITTLAILDNGLIRLIRGFDSYGNVCNTYNAPRYTQSDYNGQDTRGLRYVFYFDYSNPIKSMKLCVKECPDVKIINLADYTQFVARTGSNLCFYNVTGYNSQVCPQFPIFTTKPVAKRCIPSSPNEVLSSRTEIIQNFINSDFIRESIVYFYDQLPKIGYLSLAALLITVILVVLLRFIARLMVIVTLVLTCITSLGVSIYLWLRFGEIKRLEMIQSTTVPLLGTGISSDTLYMIYAILATTFTVVLFLVVIVLRKRITLVIKLFAEAQKALAAMPFMFFLPIVTFLILTMFLAYWILTALMIYSFGDYESITTLQGQVQMHFNRYNVSKVLWAYHFVALIWISEFIFAAQSMLVASAVAKWYFTRDKSQLDSPLTVSFKRLFVYHLGSVALGSFLITLIRVPRYILMYLQTKLKAAHSDIAKFCGALCICCLYCLEKFMVYINYNAYTIIAIEGKSFCIAAKKAFSIVVENALAIATINSVGDFMLLLAKLAVMACTLVLSVFVLDVPTSDITFDEIKIQILPLLVIAIISFLIAHCFFTVYEMVIDALMVCFCEDIRANDGSAERPYYMSSSLKHCVDSASAHTDITIDK